MMDFDVSDSFTVQYATYSLIAFHSIIIDVN